VRRASVAHRAFGTTKRRPRPRRRRERFWLIRAKERKTGRVNRPLAHLSARLPHEPSPSHFANARDEEERHGGGDRARGPSPHASRGTTRTRRPVEARPERETKKAPRVPFLFKRKSCAKTRKSPRACASPSEAFSEAFYPGEWISNHAPNVAFGFRDGASFRLPRFFLD
jgi:hypothetical protein